MKFIRISNNLNTKEEREIPKMFKKKNIALSEEINCCMRGKLFPVTKNVVNINKEDNS